MSFAALLRKIKFVSPERLLEIYPPFLFMGVKVKYASKNFRALRVHLPLRWYGKNQYGTMFGGFMCAVADPLPALLCSRLFPGAEVWTKANSVTFLKPAATGLEYEIRVADHDVSAISSALDEHGRCEHRFVFDVRDRHGHAVARVENIVYLRRHKRTGDRS